MILFDSLADGWKSMSSHKICASATMFYRNIMMPDAPSFFYIYLFIYLFFKETGTACIFLGCHFEPRSSHGRTWVHTSLASHYPITHLFHMSRWAIGCCGEGRRLQWVMNLWARKKGIRTWKPTSQSAILGFVSLVGPALNEKKEGEKNHTA